MAPTRGRRAAIGGCLGALAVFLGAASPAAAAHRPEVQRVRCAAGCAGARQVATGSVVRWSGLHLATVVRVRFPAQGGGRVDVKPMSTAGNFVTAGVPAGAGSGRPVLVAASGTPAFAKQAVDVVSKGAILGPGAFKLLHSRVRPKVAFYAGRPIRLSYRVRARGPRNVALKLVRVTTGAVVDTIRRRQVAPFAKHRARWDGAKRGGGPAPAGAYELRVARVGERGSGGGRFRVFPDEFPVRGSHDYGGAVQRFGAPRSGGRVHQGQDIFSACGTREVAARGGRVQAEGYDPVLYGYWLVIDGHGTGTDYRYAHLEAATPRRRGERVRTGQTVGHVGRTGNAQSVGCMLHFEEWPDGWENGSPVDPLPDLRRWDGWS